MSRSQRPHLNDIDLRGIPRFGGDIQVVEVIAGDNEDDGRGAEGHLLLGSVTGAARPGHDDGSDGALDLSKRTLFEAALQPGQAGAEQLQQTAAELGEHERREEIRAKNLACPHSLVCQKHKLKLV